MFAGEEELDVVVMHITMDLGVVGMDCSCIRIINPSSNTSRNTLGRFNRLCSTSIGIWDCSLGKVLGGRARLLGTTRFGCWRGHVKVKVDLMAQGQMDRLFGSTTTTSFLLL